MELTQEQIFAAKKWLAKHKEHVSKLVACCTDGIAPPEEDAGRPDLWKSYHWRWFLSNEI